MPNRSKLWTSVTLIAALFIIAANFALPYYPPSWPFKSLFERFPYRLGLDLKGGAHLVYQADTSRVPDEDKESAINGVRDVIERRINAFGVSEPLVQTNEAGGNWRVIIEMAGVFDVQEAIKQIGETPLLEFKIQNPAFDAPLTIEQTQQLQKDNEQAKKKAEEVLKKSLLPNADFAALARENSDDPGSKDKGGDLDWVSASSTVPEFDQALFYGLKPNETTRQLVQTQFGYHIIKKFEERETDKDGEKVKEARAAHILVRIKSEADLKAATEQWQGTSLTGKQLKRASVQFNGQTGEPNVNLEFNDEGADLFAKITSENIGKPVAIFLDNQPISVPTVQQKIEGGSAVITGRFNLQEAKQLAERLNAGALPVPITLIAQTTIGPSLGFESLERSLKAGVLGIIVVMLFMILYYRLPGAIASCSLMIYAVTVLMLFKLIPVTLTLAGIAGFILSVGMAVDANILIFERMKEEMQAGKTLVSAVEEGFKRAWTSIRDSNVSSLITAAVLMWFGSSVIKGFAITLALGIIISMFTAITVSRTFLRLIAGTGLAKRQWLFGASMRSTTTKRS